MGRAKLSGFNKYLIRSGIAISNPPADLFRARVRELERLFGSFFRSHLLGKSFILKAVVFKQGPLSEWLNFCAESGEKAGNKEIS
jgi:hypothetical protein